MDGANLERTIQRIECCCSIDELKNCLNGIIGRYGFSAFSFVDAGQPHLDMPFHFSSTGDNWENDYKSNGFVRVDHCLSLSRRANRPFTWKDAVLPARRGKRKPGAHLLMEATKDHNFHDGYVLPFHYVDQMGRAHSAVSCLFWSEEESQIEHALAGSNRYEIELILTYWLQRTVDLVALERGKISRFGHEMSEAGTTASLTDRERDVLSWAGRGLTAADTAEVLGLSIETIQTHIAHAAKKMGANNKTHAVTLAWHLGLIDL